MSDKYQYPCECGQVILVTVNDAGREIECDGCGARIELPGMREIRKLEPETSGQAVAENAKQGWTYEKGVWFSFGLGAAIVGALIAGICFYIGHYKFLDDRPNVRGDWVSTSEKMPAENYPVFAYAPEPLPDRLNYEYTIWEEKNGVWIFEDKSREPVPREYFVKWGDSYRTSIESSVENATMKDLWKFWYQTEPKEPLQEWQEPSYVVSGRFAFTYYCFSAVGLAVAVMGCVMVFYSVTMR